MTHSCTVLKAVIMELKYTLNYTLINQETERNKNHHTTWESATPVL
uniref:Uncharacterized protein n=2 Tax=Anguilla anguilla TaxID=7936 RepID=A0A0E9RR81_ANGAN